MAKIVKYCFSVTKSNNRHFIMCSNARSLSMGVDETPRLRPFTVAVEGNIASGKTTFLDHFRRSKNVAVVTEPVEMWRNCKGHNLLGLLYEDPKKYSFTFQSYVQLTMLQRHLAKPPEKVKLMERSIYSARYCFVERMIRDGTLPVPSATVIDEWFKWLCENHDVGVDLIIYLRTSPLVAYERVLSRSRPEERKVPFEYIRNLHEIHEDWLHHKTLHSCPAQVITIDADLDLNGMEEEYGKCESQILNRRVSA